MTGGVECVREDESILDAARKMKDLDVGRVKPTEFGEPKPRRGWGRAGCISV